MAFHPQEVTIRSGPAPHRLAAPPLLAALLLLAAAPACRSPDAVPDAATVEVFDSAGVRVTLHPPASSWDTVPPEPVLSIGTEGDPRYEFFRIATVLPLGSGNIVVANGGTREVLFYDSTGGYLRSVGGPGEGPAEFGFLGDVWLRDGDTLAVLDPRRRRVVTFDSAGAFVEGTSFAEDLGADRPSGALCAVPGLRGLLSDGTRVIAGWGCLHFEGSDGLRSWDQPLFLVGEDGTDTVGVFGSGDVWERAGAAELRDMYAFLPFSPLFLHAVSGDRLVVSEAREYELLVFDRDARLVGKVRESGKPPPVTAEDRARYVAEREAAGNPHPDDVPFPEVFGTYSRLVVAHGGDVWAGHQARPGEEDRRWTVFPADGAPARRLVLPDIRVEAVQDGRIYGFRTDDLGIQRVEVYRVPQPG